MSTLAKTVAEEQQAHDEAEIEAADDTSGLPPAKEKTTDDPEGKALFDRSKFETEELALPKVDDQTIDRISVKLTGEIMLDRSDPADVALFRKLKLGKEVELRLAGKVTGSGGRGNTNRDGDLDVVVGTKTIKADTVYVLDPNEL